MIDDLKILLKSKFEVFYSSALETSKRLTNGDREILINKIIDELIDQAIENLKNSDDGLTIKEEKDMKKELKETFLNFKSEFVK